MKKILNFVLALTVFTGFTVPTTDIYANDILYNQKETETITKGVTYELSHRLTEEGWVDVNVLKINLEDSNISVSPVQSTKEVGLKEHLTNLLYENGAVAGVNSDFFGLKGTYSASFGTAIKDGNLMYSSDDKNTQTDDYSTFFIDNNNVPFFGFLKINFEFLNNGMKNIDINAVNKAGDQIYAMKLDRNGAKDTKSLDNRFVNLVKLVIENDVITYISLKGETVNVPENGYVIVINEQWYDERANLFSVGQSAEFKVSANIDVNNMKQAISGGAKILDNGMLSEYPGATISPNSRQPRTAIGISQDGTELILMVVDGRSHSIGATQAEMAELLTEYGAYNAMNFDGGGSSTLVAKTLDDEWLTIKNTLSEGSQRKIINGLGVFNKSTLGDIVQLVVKPEQTRVFKNTPVKIETYGYDEYYHQIDLDSIILSASDKNGKWDGHYFYPSITGDITITAQYGDKISNTTIKSSDAAEIRTDISSVGLEVGEYVYMNLAGVDYDGFKANINPIAATFEINPSSLGTFENGKFIALSDGEGYIKFSVGNAVRYVPVVVGSKTRAIDSFENFTSENIKFTSVPETLNGSAAVTSEQASDGQKSLRLNYSFDLSDSSTQAAYLEFIQPIELDNPTSLELDVYGDNSNNWLRARVIDADNKEYLVDFAKEVNWNGWQKVKAKLPSTMKYPIKLDRIYIAALSNANIEEHTIYIDNLKGVFNLPSSTVELPQSTTYSDKKKVNLAETNLPDSYDITILPSITVSDEVKPENYAQVQSEVFEKFKNNSSLGIFAGDANVESGTGIIKYASTYNISAYSNVTVMQMTAKNGGLRNTYADQWKVFENDLLNLTKDNIIIVIDKNPLNFTDDKEKQLFKDVAEKAYSAGKNIFVVSSEGEAPWVNISNGIRYINLGSLFKEDGTVNDKFKMLRFRISANTMFYNFE